MRPSFEVAPALHVAARGSPTPSHEVTPVKVLANALGYAVGLGALSLYVPIILKILKHKGEIGLSVTTWSLQLMGLAVGVVYHVRSGYPLSTYMDFAALSVQSSIILVLLNRYCDHVSPISILPLFGLSAALLSPLELLRKLQVGAACVTTFALLPQVVKNFRAHTGGGWSPISAALSSTGNIARIVTTLTLASADPVLLFQYGTAFVFNSILLTQTLVWK